MNKEEFDSLELSSQLDNLRLWNNAYRKGNPIISDAEWDCYYKRAIELHPEEVDIFNELTRDETLGTEIPLEYVMGSLRNYHHYPDKTISDYEASDDIDVWATKWYSSYGLVRMDKIDGVSILVTWINGHFAHAELRGTGGVVGSDITKKARLFIPNKLPDIAFGSAVTKLVLRGEVVFTRATDCGYKNRRNAAAGVLHRLDDDRHVNELEAYFYEVVDIQKDNKDARFSTICTELSFIKNALGLKVVNFDLIKNEDIHKLCEILNKRIEEYDRSEYDIDGQVLCPNDFIRENVKLPRGKVAFKPAAQFFETVVTSVEIQVSRLGRLQPVVHYDPVDIGGVTCSKATGFNYGFMETNQVGIGSKILICRAQEVVPKVERVLSGQNFIMPTGCPACGCRVYWDDNHVHLLCKNEWCHSKFTKKVAHFFATLGVEEFTETSFAKLTEALGINRMVSRFYELTVDEISSIDGFGEKSAKSLVDQIEKTKKTKPEILLRAMGLPYMGNTICKLLLDNFSWDDLINCRVKAADVMGLEAIKEKRAEMIEENLIFANSFLNTNLRGVDFEFIEDDPKETSNSLAGKSFCITGKIEAMKRPQAEQWVRDHGGDICSVKNIQNMYLVCNEPSTSSKYKKALELKIPIITEDELFAMA